MCGNQCAVAGGAVAEIVTGNGTVTVTVNVNVNGKEAVNDVEQAHWEMEMSESEWRLEGGIVARLTMQRHVQVLVIAVAVVPVLVLAVALVLVLLDLVLLDLVLVHSPVLVHHSDPSITQSHEALGCCSH